MIWKVSERLPLDGFLQTLWSVGDLSIWLPQANCFSEDSEVSQPIRVITWHEPAEHTVKQGWGIRRSLVLSPHTHRLLPSPPSLSSFASSPCLVPACALSLHTSLPSLFLPSGVSFQDLCLINSKISSESICSPTATPLQFPLCFYLFHPDFLLLWKTHLIHFRKLLYKGLGLPGRGKAVVSPPGNRSRECSARGLHLIS